MPAVMEFETLMDYLHHNGVAPLEQDLMKWTGRSKRTWRRWRQHGVPAWAAECIIRATGLWQVPTQKSHEVWKLQNDGNIRCPAGDVFHVSELRAIEYYKKAMHGYRIRYIALERELLDIKQGNNHGAPGANDLEFLPSHSR